MKEELTYKRIIIRKKPWWTKVYMPRATAFTMLDKIYAKDKIYNEIENNKMSIKTQATMVHEVTHIMRFRKYGILKSEMIYWLNKSFRYKEELAAIRADMKVIKKHKNKYPIKKYSKSLSGFSYLWCTDYKTAKNDLEKLWKET